jgi:hypothetical protein
MPRKFVFTAIVFVTLAIATASGAALSANAQAPQPLANPGEMSDNLSVSPTALLESSASLPEAAPVDGPLVDTPAADDRDSTALRPGWLWSTKLPSR